MAKWLVLLLVAAGLLAGAWLATGGGGTRGALETAPAITQGPAAAPRAAHEERTGDPRIEAAPSAEDAVEELFDPVRSAAASEVEVRVVDADGRPIPGARLVFVDRSAVDGWRDAWTSAAGRDALVRRHGRRHVADAGGRALVPFTTSGAVVGREPDVWGEAEWSAAPDGPVELLLGAEVDLQVRVVDPHGRPRDGVRVSIVCEDRAETTEVLWRETSAPLGVARFTKLRRVLRSYPSGARFFATLPVPCADPPRVAVDPLAIPGELQELVMPATGRLHVRVVDERGAPVEELAEITLGTVRRQGDEELFQPAVQHRLVQGEATFPHVGVGAALAVKLDGSRDRPPLVSKATGPSRAGAEERLVIEWTDRYPAVVGRAVLAGGDVLVQHRGRCVLTGEPEGAEPHVATDQHGAFRIVIKGASREGSERRLEVTLFTLSGEPPLRATLELPRLAAGRDVELGDVVFHPLPPLVSGTVRDGDGAPVLGAHLRIDERAGTDWRPAPELSASSDTAGRFTVYGESEASELRLSALRRGYQAAEVTPVRPGTSGLEVVLRAAGAVGREER